MRKIEKYAVSHVPHLNHVPGHAALDFLNLNPDLVPHAFYGHIQFSRAPRAYNIKYQNKIKCFQK